MIMLFTNLKIDLNWLKHEDYLIIILFSWINMWHREIIQTALKCCITTKDFNTNDHINKSMLVHHQLLSISFPFSFFFFFFFFLMTTYQSIPSYWASSRALAHFGHDCFGRCNWCETSDALVSFAKYPST